MEYYVTVLFYPMRLIIISILLCTISTNCTRVVKTTIPEIRIIFQSLEDTDITKTEYCIIDSFTHFNEKAITDKGITYLITEFEGTKAGKWDKEIFPTAIIISKSRLNSLAHSFEHTPIYYSFSLPYFTKDKTSFLIYYKYYCGDLCAESSLKLFQKEKGKWVFIKNIFSVVS
jgi:hypothetical protein